MAMEKPHCVQQRIASVQTDSAGVNTLAENERHPMSETLPSYPDISLR